MKNKKQIIKFKFLTPQGELLPVSFLAWDNREVEVMTRKWLPGKNTHTTYCYKLKEGTLYRDVRNVSEYTSSKRKWWEFWKPKSPPTETRLEVI